MVVRCTALTDELGKRPGVARRCPLARVTAPGAPRARADAAAAAPASRGRCRRATSALPVPYPVRYPVRYLPLLLESQYKVLDARCVRRRSNIDKPEFLYFAPPAPHIGDSVQTGGNALGNTLGNALVTHWKRTGQPVTHWESGSQAVTQQSRHTTATWLAQDSQETWMQQCASHSGVRGLRSFRCSTSDLRRQLGSHGIDV